MRRVAASNKYASKIATVLCVVSFFLSVAASSANALATAEDINNLAEKVRLTGDTFMQESFELRMKYEYSGQFLNPNDRDNLHKLAKRASNKLQAIADEQRELKRQIEDYEGDDWDERYGLTGLWRKLSADLYKSKLNKCEIDFYLALTASQQKRDNVLHKILAEIDSLNLTRLPANCQLLKAKTLALLGRSDPAYKQSAINQFNMLMVRSDMSHSTVFGTAIERIKLVGLTEPGQLEKLTKELSQSGCADDLELVLSLAFLQRRYAPELFERTIKAWPQTEDFLGSSVLSDLSHRITQGQLTKQNLEQISVFEAELTALAAWKNETEDYKTLLDHLSSAEKFQTPLILYVSAVKFVDSSPTKAINLLVKASKLQKIKKSDKLDVAAYEIAKQAAQLAYNLFISAPASNKQGCPLAIEAFDNYSTMAKKKVDEELGYLYSMVLNDCGEDEKARKLLQKIADRPTGVWRNRAKLDLIVQEIQQTQDENQSRQNELLEQLSDFILSCRGQDKNSNRLRMEAISIYCQTLLERNDKLSAQKVLEILDNAETTRGSSATGINLYLFKSQALQQLGRLDESAGYMLLAIEPDSGSLAGVVVELLSEVVDTIDQLQIQTDDFNKMMQDCKKLAEFCYVSLNNRQSGLFLAEISVFAAEKEKGKLLEVDKLLNNLAKSGNADDVDLVRCRARLSAEQDKFSEAAELWAQICKMRKNEALLANKRSWKWWRAKFYELNYWAKCPQTKKEDILHTIEILENSFPDIPPLWAEKMNLLK